MLILFFLTFTLAQVNFVAVGDDSASSSYSIAYSNNGISWTKVPQVIFSQYGNNVAYSAKQRRWVAVGKGTNTLAYSDNGVNWVPLGNSIFTVEGLGVDYSFWQDQWVAVGRGNNTIARSRDGITWIGYNNPIFDDAAYDVAYTLPNLWVAVGGFSTNVALSSDGILWGSLGKQAFMNATGKALSISYSSISNRFIVTGIDSFNTQGFSTDAVTWFSSLNLLTPSATDSAFGQGNWLVTGTGTYQFVVTTTGGSGFTRTTPVIKNLQGITYNLAFDRWVTVGSKIAYSANGATWFAANTNFSVVGNKVGTTGENTLLSPVVGVVGSTTVNSSLVDNNQLLAVNGNLTINGTLVVLGSMSVTQNATVNVLEAVELAGNLNVSANFNNTVFTANLMVFRNVSSITIVLDHDPGVGTFVMRLATYSNTSGEVNFNPLVINYRSALCATQTPTYGETTLSVTLDVRSCSGSGGSLVVGGSSGGGSSGNPETTSNGGLSKEAIIGIAVGAGVVGVGLAVLGIILMKRQMRKETERRSRALREEQQSSLQAAKMNM